MKSGSKLYALVALTALMGSAVSAIAADTVTLNWASGTNPTPSATVGTNVYDGSVGLMKFVVSSTTPPVDNAPTGDNPFTSLVGQTIGTYCIDPFDGLSNPDTYTLHLLAGDTINSDNGNMLVHFFAKYAGSVGSDGTKAAAFQTAIWEIITDHDGDPANSISYTAGTGSSASLKNGNFKFDSSYVGGSVYSQVDSWLNGGFMTSDITGWKVWELDAGYHGQSQIYGSYAPAGGPHLPTVPVPAAAWLGLSMLGALAGVRTVRRRSHR